MVAEVLCFLFVITMRRDAFAFLSVISEGNLRLQSLTSTASHRLPE